MAPPGKVAGLAGGPAGTALEGDSSDPESLPAGTPGKHSGI